MPQAPPREAWSEALLDGANLRLAEEAAQAAGVPIERWLERAIRRACSGPGKITVLPPGALSEAGAEPERRSPWRLLPLLAPPLLLIGAFAWLAQPPTGTGVEVALPKAPQAEVALPPATAPAAPAAEPAPSDPAQLALWLEPRAAHGDPVAQYRLGTLYALGKGVAKDYTRAAPLLHAAAESGLAEAEYDYAVLCEKGYGVAQDPPQAIAWYRKAAAQNNADAELALGYAYAKGIGVDRDMAQAAQWFHQAAEQGVIDAQYNLAFLYEHGDGVPNSPIDAYGWYGIAAAQGDKGSQDAVDRLARSFSPAQLKAAQARQAELLQSVKPER